MKNLLTVAALAFSLLILAGFGLAQTPQDELSQLVAQLQKTPTDNALREKTIKLAAAMKPPPTISDTTIEFEGRARFAFKNAKSETDFVKAAEEYEKAIASAPWVSGYYSDICMIYEKANKLEDAKRNCEFYLIGLSDPAAITEVKLRIAGLKYGMEQNAAKKAEQYKTDRAEDEKRRAEQATRDVITKIKNIVNNRTYANYSLNYRSQQVPWGGVSKIDLFGGSTYYLFQGLCPSTWKFFDDHVELWSPPNMCDQGSSLSIIGESWGPEITDMRWFNSLPKGVDREPSRYTPSDAQFTRTWGYFEPARGYLYINRGGEIPLKDSEGDPNKRYYTVFLHKPF